MKENYKLFYKNNNWILYSPDTNETIITKYTQSSDRTVLEGVLSKLKCSPLNHLNDNIDFICYIHNYIDSKAPLLSPHVLYNYLNFCFPRIEEYFKPFNFKISDIKVSHINDFNNYLISKGYARSSIIQISKIIRPALDVAFKNGLLNFNPYNSITPIPKTWCECNFYNKSQLKKLLTFITGNKFELALKIAIYYGLRRSELLGLRWSAIDFSHNCFDINHKVIFVNGNFICSDKLKTPKSYRTLPIVPEIKNSLIMYKKQKLINMDKVGINYNHNFDDYVFTDDNGNLIKPARLDYALSSTIKKHNLPHLRFHDLRHSCASLLLSQGVQLKEIQEWLGHSSYRTTADIYSHLDMTTKMTTAKSLSRALSNSKIPISKELSIFNKLTSYLSTVKELGYTSLDEFYECISKEVPANS